MPAGEVCGGGAFPGGPTTCGSAAVIIWRAPAWLAILVQRNATPAHRRRRAQGLRSHCIDGQVGIVSKRIAEALGSHGGPGADVRDAVGWARGCACGLTGDVQVICSRAIEVTTARRGVPLSATAREPAPGPSGGGVAAAGRGPCPLLGGIPEWIVDLAAIGSGAPQALGPEQVGYERIEVHFGALLIVFRHR